MSVTRFLKWAALAASRPPRAGGSGHGLWLRFATDRGLMASIAAFNALLILITWGVVQQLIEADRQQTINVAVARNDNLVTAFEQYVMRTIESADAAVTHLVREYEREGDKIFMTDSVRNLAVLSPTLIGIALADTQGNALITADGGVHVNLVNVADREHFAVHVAQIGGKAFIGKPVIERTSGKAVIPVTKRLSKPDGAFGGVAMALIERSRFTDLLRDTRPSSLDLISVIGTDGVTRARLTGNTASAGEDISRSPLFTVQARNPNGNYRAKDALKGIPSFFSYRTLPTYNVIVTVGVAESAVMIDFLTRRRLSFMVASMTTALITVFTLLLMVALNQHRHSKIALDKTQREQRRMALQVEHERARLVEAQMVANIGSWDTLLADMTVSWSTQTYRIFEIEPGTFQPTHAGFLDLIHPDDRVAVDMAFVASLNSRMPSVIEHRIVMSDGRVKIVEERWQVFHDDAGQPVRATGTIQDISRRRQAEQVLQDYTLRLQSTSRQLLTAQEDERRNLARDLHDTTGQELTALSLNLSMIRSGLPAELAAKIATSLDDSQSLLEAMSRHLRDIMVELRPAGLDELGLFAALQEHARRVARRSNIDLIIHGAEPGPRFDSATEIALFRIAQEALNNIIKHAQAKTIEISLIEDRATVRLTVKDDGCGFDTTRNSASDGQGMGLSTMRERAETIGGQYTITSTIAMGTIVTVEVPRNGPERSLVTGIQEILHEH